MADVDEELQAVAERAFFHFDVDQRDVRDSAFIMAGDGVDDLDRVISMMEDDPRMRVQLDTSASNSSWRQMAIEDVRELRGYFIDFYGTVNKPDVYDIPPGKAVQL